MQSAKALTVWQMVVKLRLPSDQPQHDDVPHPPNIGLRTGRLRQGFTLIEVLVASTVLVLLIVLTTQLINHASSVIDAGDKRTDADGQARIVFSRLAQDMAGMLRRKDANGFFVKNAGNDAFYFYSQTAGFFAGGEGAPAPLTLVGYRIAHRANPSALAPNGILERVGIGMGYDNLQAGKVARFLTYPASTVAAPTPLPVQESTLAWAYGENGNPSMGNVLGGPPTWDNPTFVASHQAPISSTVFRLEFCFLMDDGTYYVPSAPGTTPWSSLDFTQAMSRVQQNAVSLIVTVALLDEKSQLLVNRDANGRADFSKAISAFVDGDNPDVAAGWFSALNASLAANSTAATLGMPKVAASQVRIYQRAFRFAR